MIARVGGVYENSKPTHNPALAPGFGPLSDFLIHGHDSRITSLGVHLSSSSVCYFEPSYDEVSTRVQPLRRAP